MSDLNTVSQPKKRGWFFYKPATVGGWVWLIVKWYLALGFIVSIVMTVAAPKGVGQASSSQSAVAVEKAQVAVQLRRVTAVQLAQDYEENTVAADRIYKGVKFITTGVVSEIGTDMFGDPYLQLRGTNQFSAPRFSFPKSKLDRLSAIRKGESVTLVCVGGGDVIKTAISKDCDFSN